MSSIDNRIVDMKFNNAQFKTGVSDTVSALDKLKSALKLDGAKNGLSDLQGSVSKFSMAGIAAGVDNISGKFNAMGAIGFAALQRISNKAMDLGTQMIKNTFIKYPMEGLQEYETKIGSVQTILANTSKHGTKLDDVTKSLGELNEYSDKTIYNFGDMTRNIGLFTNAGLKLEDATSMIKGFSNEAAASGTGSAQAAGAAYQLSQALSAGTVRLMDWRSLTNAGMGNKNMQQGLIDIAHSMGEFEKAGIDASVANEDFNGSLEKNWLSADVMSAYLQIMAGDMDKAQMASLGLTDQMIADFEKQQITAEEAATKVRTWTQLVGTMGEAVGSGWAQSVELILGDFNEATELFTGINNVASEFIGNSAKARNEQLKIWKDMGGRQAVLDGFLHIYRALSKIAKPIGDAFREMFPSQWGKTLGDISFKFRDLAKKLVINDEQARKVGKVAKTVFGILKGGLGAVKGILRYAGDTAKVAWDLGGAIGGLIAPVGKFFGKFLQGAPAIKNTNTLFGDLIDMGITLRRVVVDGVVKGLGDLKIAINEVLNGDPSKFNALWKKSFDPIKAIPGELKKSWQDTMGWFGAKYTPIVSGLGKAWDAVSGAISSAWGVMKDIGSGLGKFFGGLGEGLGGLGKGIGGLFDDFTGDQVLATVNTGLLLGLVMTFKKIFRPVTDLKESLKGIGDGITGTLDQLTATLKTMQQDVKANILLKIAGGIALLAAAIFILSKVEPDRLISSVTAMATAMGILMGAMWMFNKIADSEAASKMPIIAISLILLAAALVVLSTAVQKLGQMSWGELAKGLSGITIMLGVLTAAAVVLSKNSGSIFKASVAMIVMATALLELAGVVYLFGMMPYDVLEQGLAVTIGLLASLTAAVVLIGKFAPDMLKSAVGLMAIATALTMLLVPIQLFGMMDVAVLQQGMETIFALTGMLTLMAVVLSKFAPTMLLSAVGLIAIAVALNLMVIPIMMLGLIPMDILVQGIMGLVGVLGVLAIAAMAMSGAGAGALAILAMAGAILALSFAIAMLAGTDPAGIGIALGALVAVFAIMGGAALLLGPLAPALIAISVAMLAFAGALMIGALATVVAAVGMLMLAPALIALVGALRIFAAVAPEISSAWDDFALIGAGLLAFGVGAAAAGAGTILLGIGLMLLGVGLILVGASGLIGATALAAVVKVLADLVWKIPQILAMAGALGLLGAALVVLGAGLILTGAGGILAAAALFMLLAAASIIPGILTLFEMAVRKLIPLAPAMESTARALKSLAGSFKDIATSARSSSGGVQSYIQVLYLLETALRITVLAVKNSQRDIKTALMLISSDMRTESARVSTEASNFLRTFGELSIGISKEGPRVRDAAKSLVGGLRTELTTGLNASADSAGAAAELVGLAIINGMVRGLRNNKSKVTGMARNVAEDSLVAAKDELGIASPSKEFYKVGAFVDDGLVDGLDDGRDDVIRSARNVAGGALKVVQDALKGADLAANDMDMIPTIRPVLDMSDVDAGMARFDNLFGDRRLNVDPAYAVAASVSADVDGRLMRTVDNDTKAVGIDNSKIVNFYQTNNSPKPLNRAEVYRQTNNQISRARGI